MFGVASSLRQKYEFCFHCPERTKYNSVGLKPDRININNNSLARVCNQIHPLNPPPAGEILDLPQPLHKRGESGEGKNDKHTKKIKARVANSRQRGDIILVDYYVALSGL